MINISEIEPHTLKENFLVALNFPGDGLVFFRIHEKEIILYPDYTEINTTNTGVITSGEWVDSARLGMSAFNIDNILRVTNCEHLYQVFMGIKSSAVRRYLYYPWEVQQGSLDEKSAYRESVFGFITGEESPYHRPTHYSEVWIPVDVDVGFAWYNPTNVTQDIGLNLVIVKYGVELYKDPDAIEKILANKTACRIATLGGMTPIRNYDVGNIYGVDFIPFDSTRAEIEKAIA